MKDYIAEIKYQKAHQNTVDFNMPFQQNDSVDTIIEHIKELQIATYHFKQAQLTITDGVDLIGYCSWSFMDLVSTHQGYGKGYGFVYINREELKDMGRIKKDNFYRYQNAIATNNVFN